jgi:hypothetical protein
MSEPSALSVVLGFFAFWGGVAAAFIGWRLLFLTVAAILAHTDAAAGPVAPPTRDWRRAGGAG